MRKSKKVRAAALVLTGILSASLLAGCSGGAATSGDAAENWPNTNVTVTLPYNAGGDTDTYCRLMSQKLGEKFGQNFVVVNMTGGSGIVAAKTVMAEKPDGYNILFNHTGAALVQEATGVADFSYTDDFTNVATIASDNTYVVVVKASNGWNNLEEMIAYAKEHPGELRYSNVYGSATHHVGLQMEKSMGITFDNLDVGTGTGERLAAFMGGQVDIFAANYMNVKDYVENGDFIALGICADERIEGVDIPTFMEQGYEVISRKNYEVKFPKGTDPAIVEKLSAAIKEISEDPEFIETLGKYYAKPFYRDADTTATEDKAEVEELKIYFEGVIPQ